VTLKLELLLFILLTIIIDLNLNLFSLSVLYNFGIINITLMINEKIIINIKKKA